ncbi:MAG: Panacea domain-containing protein [Bacteroidia bacterium]|nr:Panacea domain-containing protein [Bacteroidia bacterium]
MASEDKFKALVLYIGNSPLVSNLGMTKLWKLIYFIDTAALRSWGNSITGSEFIKYEHGPVPSKGEKVIKRMRKDGDIEVIQENHRAFRIHRIVARTPLTEGFFSSEEVTLINEILQNYGQQTASYLSELSHREPAWHYAENLQKLEHTLMFYGSEEDPNIF